MHISGQWCSTGIGNVGVCSRHPMVCENRRSTTNEFSLLHGLEDHWLSASLFICGLADGGPNKDGLILSCYCPMLVMLEDFRVPIHTDSVLSADLGYRDVSAAI